MKGPIFYTLIMGCIFCQIIDKKKPAKVFWEDDKTIVFADLLPRAAVHLLICPKDHYERLIDLPDETIIAIMSTAKTVAVKLGLTDNFKLLLNNGAQAGQIVGHLHFHFLSNQPGVVLEYLA